jgi:hypothetical protein
MKTAETIARQESKKEDDKSSVFRADNSTPVSAKRDRRKDAERLKPFRFQPGVSGNPGGRPKVDLASEIARALFENDAEAIYAAFQKVLRKGSPYGFQVLADRAFGRLKETHAIEHVPFKDESDEDLQKKIFDLEVKLGYRLPAEPKVLPPADETKLN